MKNKILLYIFVCIISLILLWGFKNVYASNNIDVAYYLTASEYEEKISFEELEKQVEQYNKEIKMQINVGIILYIVVTVLFTFALLYRLIMN